MARIVLTAAIFLVATSISAQTPADIDSGNAAAYMAWRAASGEREIIVRGSTPEATERLLAILALNGAMTSQPARSFARASAMSSATSPDWSQLPQITIPPHSAEWTGWGRSYAVTFDDQLRQDLDTSLRWADGANKACACNGYDGLRGNAAVIEDWRLHSGGEDPVKWLCEQGYDSPLATFTPLFTFNRTVDDAALTEVVVQYNGVNYPATFLRADCLAGCTVTARVPCAGEKQATIIKLSRPGGAPEKCVWRYGVVGGGFPCPR